MLFEELSKWLQAMFHSGSISSFVSVQIPTDSLKTGWIGQGLIQKGFSGKLEDKKNQEELVIPLDRFVRLTNEWIDEIEPHLGLFILGTRGLTKPRFVALVSNDDGKREAQPIAIAFQSNRFGLRDTIHQLVHFISGKKATHEKKEPNLDYIEQLKVQTSGGLVTQLLTLKLPDSPEKVTELMRSIKNNNIDSKSVFIEYGGISQISSVAPLVSKWLIGLELFQRTKDRIAAFVFVLNSALWLCLWDSFQKIVTFSVLDQDDIENTLMDYVYPLWFTSDDLESNHSTSPSVILRTGKTQPSTSKSTSKPARSIKSTSSYDSVEELEGLIRRIRLIETQMHTMENAAKESDGDSALSVVSSRLTDTVEKLESLVAKLNALEKRIDKVSKETS